MGGRSERPPWIVLGGGDAAAEPLPLVGGALPVPKAAATSAWGDAEALAAALEPVEPPAFEAWVPPLAPAVVAACLAAPPWAGAEVAAGGASFEGAVLAPACAPALPAWPAPAAPACAPPACAPP